MRETGDFKPSEVVLSTPPLTACFKKTEAEFAAGLLVWYMAHHGDTWQRVTIHELTDAVLSNLNVPLLRVWYSNPFLQSDFPRLITGDFVDLDPDGGMMFTELGLSRLRPWVRSAT